MNPKLFEAINKKQKLGLGEFGLPEHYPAPPDSQNLLFYIQRNHNLNTVVYEINRLHDGRICEDHPMHVFWMRYSDNGDIRELNYIQNKLAYGYEATQISRNTFEFQLVSYRKLKFYIDKIDDIRYGVFTCIDNKMSLISNIYVYAEDYGLFPDVKYIELYGTNVENNSFNYEKLYI